MATFFGSPTFLSNTLPRTNHVSSSSQTPPPPSSSTPPPSQSQPSSAPISVQVEAQKPIKPVAASATKAESTDWIASTLTRRFGLGAGLAWVGFLAFGVVSEQIKTRFEVSQQQSNTRDVEKEEEVVLPNGIRYVELRVGGGNSPRTGDLLVIDLKGKVEGNGEIFVDTFGGEHKSLALVMGSRPYSKGMCEGIENVLKTMKAGGKRRVMVPANLGFGENGADLGSGVQIPPFATLEYIVEVDKVSIAPA
ncbi:peptidyl-prolyl cis-trans isomerase FKBP17-2, chloroplastic [Mercurialis annua]|uniref:peptidyl-prolyl cis-trans isomerase FKBP17-2, chloroplastic n=1 Tax=Mercurialis annua TaxID=3986 RepID=UPI0021601DE4|nr:peptidyl-prolyl cis-trans isomerase FKBP17-2, chloroplastic [Mercurialis annua]